MMDAAFAGLLLGVFFQSVSGRDIAAKDVFSGRKQDRQPGISEMIPIWLLPKPWSRLWMSGNTKPVCTPNGLPVIPWFLQSDLPRIRSVCVRFIGERCYTISVK